jgi:hypothetical protein
MSPKQLEYVIRNSARQYWRGETTRQSQWTPAIALAHKFKTKRAAETRAYEVGGNAILAVSKSNVVEEVIRI